MRAVVVSDQPAGQSGLRLVSDYIDPGPRPGEVRIRTVLAGICNTDLEIVRGYAGYAGVLGHEFVGIVDQAEDPAWLGRRVVGEINVSCGECTACRAGRANHCPQRTALGIRGRDGVLADYFCLPTQNLHLVPDDMPDEVAVFAEPVAAACQVLVLAHVQPNDRVLVLGDGKLGLLVAQVLALTGCDLTVVGRHDHKLAVLTALGIHTQIGTHGLAHSADLVVECTGRAEGFEAARRLVRPLGTLMLKSTVYGTVETELSSLVVDEIRVIGSRCGPFPVAMRLLSRGWLDTKSLIEAEYPLDDAITAFERALQRGALKVLIRP